MPNRGEVGRRHWGERGKMVLLMDIQAQASPMPTRSASRSLRRAEPTRSSSSLCRAGSAARQALAIRSPWSAPHIFGIHDAVKSTVSIQSGSILRAGGTA
jgi:hypothetical protein